MNSINEVVIVPPQYAGERLDKVATVLFGDFSRAQVSNWITQGELTVDDRTVKAKTKMVGGERLCLNAQRSQREAWQEPQAITLDVLFEDEHIIVIDKAPGLVVHPGAGNPSGTLVNGLLKYRPELTRLPRAGVVHRLDKDTSGVMVIAASDKAHRQLTLMINERAIQRRYVCVCEGRMVAGKDVDQPIGRDAHVRTRQAVREDGKPAFTSFRVRQRYRVHTLLDAQLGSGRTHQIRVHAQSMGHPLVGDRRYGARGKLPQGSTPEFIQTLQAFPRQALHAHSLTLQHPIADTPLEFVAPWPSDFETLVSILHADLKSHPS